MKKYLFLLSLASIIAAFAGCATKPVDRTYNPQQCDMVVAITDTNHYTLEKPIQQAMSQDQVLMYAKAHPVKSCCIILNNYDPGDKPTWWQKFNEIDPKNGGNFRDMTDVLFMSLRVDNVKEIVVVKPGSSPTEAIEIAHYY